MRVSKKHNRRVQLDFYPSLKIGFRRSAAGGIRPGVVAAVFGVRPREGPRGEMVGMQVPVVLIIFAG